MDSVYTIWRYFDEKAASVRSHGRIATSDNYLKTKRCLQRFRDFKDLSFSDITEEFVWEFNNYLKTIGVTPATISFYNRVLRSIYNQAAGEGLVKNAHPFDQVYTKVETRFIPVRVNDETGARLNLDSMPREELETRYRNLQRKYNTLVGKLSTLVRI